MKRKGFLKLKVLLLQRNIYQNEFAESIGMAASTFNQKINCSGTTFTLEEASLICSRLSISLDEYFFVDVVPKTKQNCSGENSA